MAERFAGTIEPFDEPTFSVPHEDIWLAWGETVAIYLTDKFYPGCKIGGVGIFTLDPGQVHIAHQDIQPPEWLVRVHLPIQTNLHCFASSDDGYHAMELGKAYKFNTLRTHAVANAGKTPRVHLVFDIKEQ